MVKLMEASRWRSSIERVTGTPAVVSEHLRMDEVRRFKEVFKDEIAADEKRHQTIIQMFEDSQRAWQQAVDRHQLGEPMRAAAQTSMDQLKQTFKVIDDQFQDHLKNMGITR